MAPPTYQTAVTLQSFNWIAVTTSADTVITCGLEDVAIWHSNLQADDSAAPSASVASDYIVVTDGSDSTTPTDDYDPGTATGSKSHKMLIKAGGSNVFRGCDMAATSTSRTFIIHAVGHTAFVQLLRGSSPGVLQ